MTDEMNTTPAAEAPAAGTPQAAPEGAAPTQEQQNAFQRFLSGLFGGSKEDPAPAESTDPAPAPKPEGKTYTEEDMQARLEAARAEWTARQQEQARLEKLPPEERAKVEADAQREELESLRTQLTQRELKDAALRQLEKDGYPTGLADLLNYTDKAAMEKSLGQVQDIFKASVEAAVKDRLRGKTPEGLGGAARTENAMRDEIARNIRGGLN